MITYISGPVKGLPEHNRPEFNRVAELWRDAGHTVFNPAEINPLSAGYTREQCLRRDIAALTECHLITFLPGWQQSKGVLIERAVAIAIGCVIHWEYDQPLTKREEVLYVESIAALYGRRVGR